MALFFWYIYVSGEQHLTLSNCRTEVFRKYSLWIHRTMAFLGIRLSEIKNICTVYHIGNIIFSLSFFVAKTFPPICTRLFGIEEDLCALDRVNSFSVFFFFFSDYLVIVNRFL